MKNYKCLVISANDVAFSCELSRYFTKIISIVVFFLFIAINLTLFDIKENDSTRSKNCKTPETDFVEV